jgi:hypothetical protein
MQRGEVVTAVQKAAFILVEMTMEVIDKQNVVENNNTSGGDGGGKFGAEVKGRSFKDFFEDVTGIVGEPHPGDIYIHIYIYIYIYICICVCIYLFIKYHMMYVCVLPGNLKFTVRQGTCVLARTHTQSHSLSIYTFTHTYVYTSRY